MDILYLLIPLSLLLVFVIAAIFWWSLRSGQFEDLEGPGYRILMDDDKTDGLGIGAGVVAATEDNPAVVSGGTDDKKRTIVDPDQKSVSDNYP